MKNTTIGWRVQLATGATLAAMACAAAAVDLINNYAYGHTISPVMAGVMVLAAAGVVIVPAAAAARGWSRHLKLATAVAVAMTVWCAASAYNTSQEASRLAAQTRQEQYLKAKEKETRAKEVLSKVKETGTVEELGTLAAKADQIETDAGRKLAEAETAFLKICRSRPYLRRCEEPAAIKAKAAEALKLAEADAKRAHERLSQAKARDKAEADLAEAESRSATGAALIREESQVLTWLGIALKAYKRFAKDAQMTAGELRSILAQIYGDALAARSSGYVVRGISLRAGTACQKKAASR